MKRFSNDELHDVLRKIPGLKASQRSYVVGMLMGETAHGGVTDRELGRAMQELKKNHSDDISTLQAGKIHEALQEHINPTEAEEPEEEVKKEEPASKKIDQSRWF